jgi:hypothetical protein
MRRRSTRGLAGSFGAVGALVIGVGASSSAPADFGDAGWLDTAVGNRAPMTVTESHSEWQDGLIVTRLSLRGEGDQAPELSVRALGGAVGDIVQVVGHALPPQPGTRLMIRLPAGPAGSGVWLMRNVSSD